MKGIIWIRVTYVLFASFLLFLPLISNAEVATASPSPPPFLLKWGTYGSGDGQFTHPWGIAVDTSGNVYVAEPANHRIQKFTSSGVFITKWGTLGSGDGQFITPYCVAVDTLGYVYISDWDTNRIQKFTSDGAFITKWGTSGLGDGQFTYPLGIGVDVSGNVYVADCYNHRIQKFTADGVFLTKWGTQGSGDGQFDYPYAVSIDTSGSVYVAEFANRIQKFTSTGNFITKWGSQGSGDGQFEAPSGIAFDATGNVYVADPGNHRIQEFTNSGTFLTKWGTLGFGDGQFYGPRGVALDASGNVYVVDKENHRVQVFGYPSGTYTITATAGANGAITPTGSVTVNYGGSKTFSITPGIDHHIADVVVDGGSVGAITSYTFSNVTTNHTIAASFTLNAVVDINPDTLNLKSQSDRSSITAYIELPPGFYVEQINVATVRLLVNGITIAAQITPASVGDYDGDKIPDCMVKFDRQAVIAALTGVSGYVSIEVMGQFTDGQTFSGMDTIRIIDPGK